MDNPFKPTLNGLDVEGKRFRLTEMLVFVIFLGCVGFVASGFLTLIVPATRPLIGPRIVFGVLFLNPLIFLVSWFRNRENRALWVTSVTLGIVAGGNAVILFRRGTVDEIQNWTLDYYHSAWYWSVAAPILFALLLIGFAMGKDDST